MINNSSVKIREELRNADFNHASSFVSVPAMFELMTDSSGRMAHIFNTFFDARPNGNRQSGVTFVAGSMVTDANVGDAMAMVIPIRGTANVSRQGKSCSVPSQRLLLKAVGASTRVQMKTLDLYPVFDELDRGNLGMSINEGHLAPTINSVGTGSGVDFRLLVGPDSAALHSAETENPQTSSAWEELFDIAKNITPIIAQSGYRICMELSNQGQGTRVPEVNTVGVGDTSPGIAKIAVPVAGMLLAAH